MKQTFLFFALITAFAISTSCGSSAKAASQQQRAKATYSRFTTPDGDRRIIFRVWLAEMPEGYAAQEFLVNDKQLDFDLKTETDSLLVEALRSYPSSGKGFDPLPPGEEPQILYLQENFSGKLVLKKGTETDTLFIKDFVEVEWEGK